MGFLREQLSVGIENNNYCCIIYRNDDIARLDLIIKMTNRRFQKESPTGLSEFSRFTAIVVKDDLIFNMIPEKKRAWAVQKRSSSVLPGTDRVTRLVNRKKTTSRKFGTDFGHD